MQANIRDVIFPTYRVIDHNTQTFNDLFVLIGGIYSCILSDSFLNDLIIITVVQRGGGGGGGWNPSPAFLICCSMSN